LSEIAVFVTGLKLTPKDAAHLFRQELEKCKRRRDGKKRGGNIMDKVAVNARKTGVFCNVKKL